ncbi:putative permease, partial [Oesophagostomum dentatum]
MFGMRLALLQGTAFAYVPSVQVFMGKCSANATDYVPEEEYYGRLALMQGCLMASSLVPMLIGFTGVVGVITKFIGPLTVSPLMLLLAFSQVDTMVNKISLHWVAVIQAVTLFITILYLADVLVPLPGIKYGKLHWYKTNLFGQYPYLIAIAISWAFCVMLTAFNLVEPGGPARVDIPHKVAAIQNSAWVAVPYPGKFGPPSFNISLFIAFLLSAMTSVFESVGDYHAAARMSMERAPPSHAINRGILAEGMGSFISGLLGPAVGMTTHTENIGVIGVTRVASRWTMVVAGVLLIVLGVCTKIGAILSTVPDPLVGGILASSMAMVVGVAVSNLQTVDMTMSRNMGILGFSMLFGMIVPEYFRRYPVHTGFQMLDQVLNILLQLQMFIGALCACILDNTIG